MGLPSVVLSEWFSFAPASVRTPGGSNPMKGIYAAAWNAFKHAKSSSTRGRKAALSIRTANHYSTQARNSARSTHRTIMHHSIEPLESRIAPAQLYFVQSNALNVLTAAGANADNIQEETDARLFAGSSAAVLLAAGDRLIFDANNDHIQNAGDTELVKVVGGSAMVFLTDGFGANNGAFDLGELTGLAVSTKFKATINGNVLGSVITALKGGALETIAGALAVQHGASIDGLTVNGKLGAAAANYAHLLAGAGISNVTFNNTSGAIDIDGRIATGSGANNFLVTLNGGGKTFLTSFGPSTGERGGDISNVKLKTGARLILAGDGGVGAVGGSIRTLTVTEGTRAMDVGAGNGGFSGAGKAAAAGGSLVAVHVKMATTAVDDARIGAGRGGDASQGLGGVGGQIVDLRLELPSAEVRRVIVKSGDGGNSADGAGGAGGAFLKSFVQFVAAKDYVDIFAGAGGDGGGKGAGGRGGALSELAVNGEAIEGVLGMRILGGAGGEGGLNGGAGGVGGALSGLGLSTIGKITSSLIGGGNGGDGGSAKGAGGSGGAVSRVHVTANEMTQISIVGGAGGDAASANGGAGGSATEVSVQTFNTVGAIEIGGGAGGSVATGDGSGGAGGAGNKLAITSGGALTSFGILSGAGGDAHGRGNGGKSGNLTNSSATLKGQLTTSGSIGAGLAGSADTLGNGGAGGQLTNTRLVDQKPGGVAGKIYLSSGIGGHGSGLAGLGGNAGSITSVIFDAPLTTVTVGDSGTGGLAGGASGTGPKAAGGAGGGISGLSGVVGDITIVAGAGGSGDMGRGGNGGSIASLALKNPGSLGVAPMISAGDGGNGAAVRGGGGSVTNVNFAGDIGRFVQFFDASIGGAGMGGLFAGEAGVGGGTATNGSIRNITALRIATILAGHPFATDLTRFNAVQNISGIKLTSASTSSKLGADVLDNGVFDFTDAGAAGLVLGGGDTLKDGLVVARAGGVTSASFGGAVPLKLVTV